MKIEVYIKRKNIIREVLRSYKEMPRYKRALESLFCAINGWTPCDGDVCNIEDSGYRELYTKTLEKIKELRTSFPDSTKDSDYTGE